MPFADPELGPAEVRLGFHHRAFTPRTVVVSFRAAPSRGAAVRQTARGPYCGNRRAPETRRRLFDGSARLGVELDAKTELCEESLYLPPRKPHIGVGDSDQPNITHRSPGRYAAGTAQGPRLTVA